MVWRGPSGAHDPNLSRKHHKALRRYWVRQVEAYGLPCSLCGRALVTDKSQFRIMVAGRLIVNPSYLVVGHIEPRALAYARGKTVRETETIPATRPECWKCSQTSGGRLGRALQGWSPGRPLAKPSAVGPPADTTPDTRTLKSRW
jgi:hypothetical protein